MKVSELIEQLQEFPPETKVVTQGYWYHEVGYFEPRPNLLYDGLSDTNYVYIGINPEVEYIIND